MDCQNLHPADADIISSSNSEALLFTTMCIIGLPVEVQVKDGSLYSGVFYTASIDQDYGIILKKARRTRKGNNGRINVSEEALIETLVVCARDLVQVVVKGVTLPSASTFSDSAADDIDSHTESEHFKSSSDQLEGRSEVLAENHTIETFQNGLFRSMTHSDAKCIIYDLTTREDGSFLESESICISEDSIGKASSVEKIGQEDPSCSQMEGIVMLVDGSPNSGAVVLHSGEKFIDLSCDLSSEMSSNEKTCGSPTSPSVTAEIQDHQSYNSDSIDCQADLAISRESPSSSLSIDISSSSCTSPLTYSEASVSSLSDTKAKEFKFNPAAKVFSPAVMSPSAGLSTFSSNGSVYYAPNSCAGSFSNLETGSARVPSAPCTSQPVKFLQYIDITSGTDYNGSQYSLPVAGHVASRHQPMRYGAQNYFGVAYVPVNNSNYQPVLFGRSGQIVSVYPVSHGAVQGATTPLSQGPGCTLVVSPQQPHLLKHHVPSLVAGGQQHYAIPAHIPLSPSVPVFQLIPVIPTENTVYGMKFR